MLFPSRHIILPRLGGSGSAFRLPMFPVSCFPLTSPVIRLYAVACAFAFLLAGTCFASVGAAAPATVFASLEILAEVEFVELDVALGFLGMMSERTISERTMSDRRVWGCVWRYVHAGDCLRTACRSSH